MIVESRGHQKVNVVVDLRMGNVFENDILIVC